MVDTSLAGSLVVEELDLLEETGLTVGIKTGTCSGVDSLGSEFPGGNYKALSGFCYTYLRSVKV